MGTSCARLTPSSRGNRTSGTAGRCGLGAISHTASCPGAREGAQGRAVYTKVSESAMVMPAPTPPPPATTSIMFFDYVTGSSATSREHTVQFRYNPSLATPSDVQNRMLLVLQALTAANFRTGWRILRVRQQDVGTNFSIPIPVASGLGSFLGTATTPTYQPRYEAVEWSLQGRSPTTGQRVDFSLYTALTDAPANFRFLPADLAQLAATVNAVQAGAATGIIITRGGSPATWYNYMNVNYNSYWERRSRTT